jgi:hypothetical protein
MAVTRNACSLLDFPEFAQAVKYGVPGTQRPFHSMLFVAGTVLLIGDASFHCFQAGSQSV